MKIPHHCPLCDKLIDQFQGRKVTVHKLSETLKKKVFVIQAYICLSCFVKMVSLGRKISAESTPLKRAA